jgi:hypothetical protein
VDLKSLAGGSGDGSAVVCTQWGGLGPVVIHGDVAGGTGLRSASVHANGTDPGPGVPAATDPTMLDYGGVVPGGGKIRGVTVTGALAGLAGGTAVIEGAAIPAPVHVGSLAGAGDFSAVIEASFGSLASVKVDGAVLGGPGVQSGYIAALGANVFTNHPYSLGPVTIGGDLRGGAGYGSGSIYASGGVGAVTVGGSMLGAGGVQSGSITAAAGAIGAVKIAGDLTAGTGQYSGLIRAIQLKLTPFTESGGTVASLTVGGSVSGGGTAGSSAVVRADRGVGAVTVGHDWTAASLVAGLVDPGQDGYFGTGDDQSFTTAAVGPVTVGGQFHGTAAAGDSFAILASQVAGLSIGGTAQALHPGPYNDSIALDGATGDFMLTEALPNN